MTRSSHGFRIISNNKIQSNNCPELLGRSVIALDLVVVDYSENGARTRTSTWHFQELFQRYEGNQSLQICPKVQIAP
jgi:hypothetical protein